MIRAFAFDLDETLTDCEPQHVLATRAMLDAADIPLEAARDAFHEATGLRTRDIVDAIRARSGVAASLDELLALRHAAFLAALDDSPALPREGAVELLDACRARGPVALVTSGHRDDVLATLASLAVTDRFATIVTGEDVARPKPDGEPYAVAASRLRVAPSEVLAFEDSARGVASAIAAGCPVVACPHPRSTRPDQVARASLVVRSLRECLPLDALLARVG